jgi:hypothetical protein
MSSLCIKLIFVSNSCLSRSPISLFCVWISNFSNTIYFKDCYSPFWFLDFFFWIFLSKFSWMFLGFLFCLFLCHFVYFYTSTILSKLLQLWNVVWHQGVSCLDVFLDCFGYWGFFVFTCDFYNIFQHLWKLELHQICR